MTPREALTDDPRPVVIVVRLSALGDVAMSSGTVTAAARRYPGTRFVVVTRPQFAPFFPPEVEVEPVCLKGRHRGPFGMVCLAYDLLRKYRPVAVADLHDVIRTRILRAVMRARGVRVAVIDKGRREKGELVKGPERHQLTTTVERYAAALRALGYDPGEPVAAPLGPPVRNRRPTIGIAPYAAHPGKSYPISLMVKAARIIRSHYNSPKIIWFSAPGSEARMLTTMVPGCDTIVANLGLEGGLADELKLMGTLDVMIGMDSGNMHMAALRGVPVVSVWGQTHPFAGFAGATSPPSLRVQMKMACRPCSVYGNRPCRLTDGAMYPCLEMIDPDDIAQAALSLITRR